MNNGGRLKQAAVGLPSHLPGGNVVDRPVEFRPYFIQGFTVAAGGLSNQLIDLVVLQDPLFNRSLLCQQETV